MSSEAGVAVTDVAELLTQQAGASYRQFLTVPAMSVGLFAVAGGHRDDQQPHRQDEVYIVISGRAVLEVAGTRTPVSAGSIAYVPAHVPHHFEDITADLHVVVVFSPPYEEQ